MFKFAFCGFSLRCKSGRLERVGSLLTLRVSSSLSGPPLKGAVVGEKVFSSSYWILTGVDFGTSPLCSFIVARSGDGERLAKCPKEKLGSYWEVAFESACWEGGEFWLTLSLDRLYALYMGFLAAKSIGGDCWNLSSFFMAEESGIFKLLNY